MHFFGDFFFTCVVSSSYLQLERLNLIQTLIPELLREDLEHGTNPRSQGRVKPALASKARTVGAEQLQVHPTCGSSGI